jgi:hypothetical protein
VVVVVLALAGPGHPRDPGDQELAVGLAHARGERLEQRPGVRHDDGAGPVRVLGFELLGHAEEAQPNVLALQRHIRVRAELVIGAGETQHGVELGDLVDGPAGKQRHGDFVGHGSPF